MGLFQVDRHREEFHAKYEWDAKAKRFPPRVMLENKQDQDMEMVEQPQVCTQY